MSRVSEGLADASVAKPATAGSATAAANATAIRAVIDALRACGILKNDSSSDAA